MTKIVPTFFGHPSFFVSTSTRAAGHTAKGRPEHMGEEGPPDGGGREQVQRVGSPRCALCVWLYTCAPSPVRFRVPLLLPS